MDEFEQLWAMQPAAFMTFMQEQAVFSEARTGVLSGKQDPAPSYETVSGAAVIPMEGIVSRQGRYGASLHNMWSALEQALADPAVKAILFAIHSPGGSAGGVKELSDAIYSARRVKPCAAWVDGLCASAAYWLASATGSVYAGPSSIVGSIGVILRHLNKSSLNEQLGLTYTYVTAGNYKAVGHPDAPLSGRDRDVLQARVDAIYNLFCGDVAQRMNLALDNRMTWADGRDFLAGEAETLGLVTAIVPSRAEAIHKLLKETHMDKAELAKSQPELLASIQQEAAQTTRKELEAEATHLARTEAEQATTTVLGLLETVCGAETANKIRALVNAQVTPDQLKAAAQILVPVTTNHSETLPLSSEQRGKSANAAMLEAIKAATPAAVGVDPDSTPQNEVTALIQRIGVM